MIAGPLLDGMPNVYDGSDPSRPPLSVGLATEEDVRNQVSELQSQGVDLLKAYEMLTPAQFAALMSEANMHGLKVTGHVPLSMDVISASNAGLHSMEHLRNLELSCAEDASNLLQQRQEFLLAGAGDPGGILRSRIHTAQRQHAIEHYSEAKAQEVIAAHAKNQTWQVPTLTLNRGMATRHFESAALQGTFTYLPQEIASTWSKTIEDLQEQPTSDFQRNYATWQLHMTEKLKRAGIPIMAGTDCPIFFLTPGYSLHLELISLVDAGLTPLEALQAATIEPARYFGLEDQLGLIKTSYLADLILLTDNPLESIENTLHIEGLFKSGHWYDRQALEKLLAP